MYGTIGEKKTRRKENKHEIENTNKESFKFIFVLMVLQ